MDIFVTAGPAPARGILKLDDLAAPCALGHGGVETAKKEGDGITLPGLGRYAASGIGPTASHGPSRRSKFAKSTGKPAGVMISKALNIIAP